LKYDDHIIQLRNERKVIRSLSIGDYYPVRYTSIESREDQLRKFVWRFKDGDYVDLNFDVLEELRRLLNSIHISIEDFVLIAIPASTMEKTKKRYEYFLPKLAEKINKTLAANAITTDDHTELKGTRLSRVKHFHFSPELYRGKGVILFDDVITTGDTFKQTAVKLIDSGASNVIGIFIARTVYKDGKYKN
jgi:predicted amidophosphoribosyltransferase